MGKESISASISMKEGAQIAKVVLMPGDPLRAKYVAENFLEDPVLFSDVRNMLGYTGTYRGRKISVMGSGMGVPSIGIYATELYSQFDVNAIIRIGSAGAIGEGIRVRDVVIAMGASTNSNYINRYDMVGQIAPVADYGMLANAVKAAEELKVGVKVGNIYTSDFFYHPDKDINTKLKNLGHLCVEMEAAGLYVTAMSLRKKALAILTISDEIFTGVALSAKDREQSFKEMMQIALETAWHEAE